jgi:hypothetical protein
MIASLRCYFVDGNGDPEDSEIIFAKSSIEAKRLWANEHGDGDRFIAGIRAMRRARWDKHAPGPVPGLELIDEGWWVECHGCGVKIDHGAIGTSDPYTGHYTYLDYGLDREYGPDLTLPICDPYEPNPGSIFCNKACHDRETAERKRMVRMKAKAIAIVRAEVMRRFPGAEIIGNETALWGQHVYVARDRSCGALLISDVRIGFILPGMKYGASLVVRDEKWRQSYIVNGRPWESRDGYHLQTTQNRAPLSTRKREVDVWVANGDSDVFDAWKSAVAIHAIHEATGT